MIEAYHTGNSTFDMMTINVKQISKNEEKHELIIEETLDLPNDFFI